MSFKYLARHISGILLLDKPTGISSNKALQIVKRLYRAKKAGHGGSLDPLASGMLPIFLGEATKFVQFSLEADKHYTVTAKLGIRTNTGDSEGHSIATRSVRHYTHTELESALKTFRGTIQQMPPMFSALKHKGQPLYALARQGIEVERKAREVVVHHLTITDYTEHTLSLEIKASKGTYVRTLVDDLGERLGCGAHVIALRREGVGAYTRDQMISLPSLESLHQEQAWFQMDGCLLPLTTTVASLPELRLPESVIFYLMQGQAVRVPAAPTSGWVKLLSKNNSFLGVGEILDDGRVSPRRLIKTGSLAAALC